MLKLYFFLSLISFSFAGKTKPISAEGRASNLQWKTVKESPLVYSFIPKKTPVIRMKTREVFLTPKDMHVWVYQMADGQGYQYLYAKNQKVQYKVQKKYVTSIQNVTQLKR
nr:hypothetical protein [Bacteriovoracaceae bacterium]